MKGFVMHDSIESVSALKTVIGKTPDLVKLKTIDHLDKGALQWIAASPAVFAVFADGSQPEVTLGGGGLPLLGGPVSVLMHDRLSGYRLGR